jgi:peptidyl-dipeptidase Dcp
MLSRVNLTFSALTAANTDDALQKTQEDVAPKLAAHDDAIYLDPKALQADRGGLQRTQFAQARFRIPSPGRVVLPATSSTTARACPTTPRRSCRNSTRKSRRSVPRSYSKLLAATKAGGLVVADKAKLAGLSDAEIDAAAQAAKDRTLDGKWVIRCRTPPSSRRSSR